MAKYLVTVFRPQDFARPVKITAAVQQAIESVNAEMRAAGVRLFAGGLQPTSKAKSVHFDKSGELSVSDGAYVDADNFVDGFWILECESFEDALRWGRKAALACQGSTEVRPFY